MYVLLILCATFVSQISQTASDRFSPPPMSTPPMPQPSFNWDTRDIKFYFGKISMYCNFSEVYFCDPNHVIRKDDAAKIVQTLHTTEEERCVNNRSRGLSLGVAVINKINVISENGSGVYMKPFTELVRTEWRTMNSKCDAAILLFVSCADFSMYESLGLNTLSIVEPRCRYLLNLTKPIQFSNDSDCFRDIIEPRISVYEQILNGTHPCYHATNHLTWIFIGIILLLLITIVIIGFVCLARSCNVKDDEQVEKTDDEEMNRFV